MMKNDLEMKNTRLFAMKEQGVALLEVVLAIAIFAFGMLALVQLQGNLTRASSDANQRTVATNIAEELVEDIRGYEKVGAIAGNNKWEYLELTGTALNQTVPRGNLNYTVTVTISDFWWDAVGETFIKTDAVDPPAPPSGISQPFADYKLIQLDVAWGSSQDFYVDDESTAILGTGSITLYEIIPSSPPILGAKIASDINAIGGGPTVDYTPGDLPDIVRLALPNERFKESSTPEPDVIRDNESVETWFDVITYNTITDATFLRREEFLMVTCECELKRASQATEDTLTPTTWNGYGYTEGESIQKPFGVEPANAQQSPFCDICCRDHHDVPNSTDKDLKYRPNSTSSHDHYGFKKVQGKVEMVIAGEGDSYLEACRLVRNDGFMRVAQDLEQSGFYGFPESYLESTTGAQAYGEFVVNAATDYYKFDSTTMNQPADVGYSIPASNSGTATNLPTVPSAVKPISTDFQQMRSRGVYLDHLTKEAKANIAACFDGQDGTPCISPAVNPADGDTEAFMYPFFDVQLTWLARWNPAEQFMTSPISVTNEILASNNTHSRGYAELIGTKMGPSEIITNSHMGNLGLTGTGAIDENYKNETVDTTIFMTASNQTVPSPVGGKIFKGTLATEVNKLKTADFILTPSDKVYCGQTDVDYACFVMDGAANPTVTLSNYESNTALYGCSDELEVISTGTSSTTFALDVTGTLDSNNADIWVQKTLCVQSGP